jgi:hypothetical protein
MSRDCHLPAGQAGTMRSQRQSSSGTWATGMRSSIARGVRAEHAGVPEHDGNADRAEELLGALVSCARRPRPSDATFRASDSVNLIRHLYKNILPALGMAFLLGACAATVNWNYERMPSNAFAHPETTSVGALFQKTADKHLGLSGFSLVREGGTAFMARLAMADLEPIPIGSRGGSVTGCRCPNGIGS